MKPETIFDVVTKKTRGFDRKAPDQDFTPPVEDGEPTDYLPGTAEKIALMRHRLEAGEHLYHEEDRQFYDNKPLTPAERAPRSGVSLAHRSGVVVIRSENP